MGSYLSIVNDTSSLWACKVGPDEAALNIVAIIAGVVTALGFLIVSAGLAAPGLTAAATAGGATIFGVTTQAAAAIAVAATSLTGAAYLASGVGFANNIVNLSYKTAYDQGYQAIPPGKSYRWGKMSLSLWQQARCKRFIPTGAYSYYSDELFMRPIFSGPTDNSNNDHSIQWWINKWGTENKLNMNFQVQAVLFGDWAFCSASTQCSNGCCSKYYSGDGQLKCTPVGGYKPTLGCIGGRRRLHEFNETIYINETMYMTENMWTEIYN